MRRKARLAGAFCAVLLALAAALRGADSDEATETFNSLYGADLARVRETGDARDDVELAARLLAAAKKAADQPALLAVLCEKACDLALGHPTGYATALEAMDLLARTVPAKAAECAARTLDIRQKQFDAATGDEKKAAGELLLGALLPVIEAKEQAGDLAEAAALYRKAKTIAAASGSPRADEIDARAEALALRMKIAARLADVKALLERDPKNVSAREGLVRLYLVDLDDPAEAAKYLEGAKDKALLKYVPAAAKGVEAPPELACLELGEWYRDLAATAPPHAREAMYARARAYLERFLEIHPAKDLSRTRATLALEKVQEAVAKLTAPPEKPTKTSKPTKATPGTIPPGTWVDLLPLVDPATDAVEGNWRRTGSAPALLSPTTDGRIMIPVSPRGSYEFEVRFVRTSGELVVGFILPVGYTGFVLALSHWRGQSHGLELINGNNASTNATTVKPGTLQNGREYLVRVSVVVGGDQVQIRVTLDGKPLIAWQGPPSALSVSANWRLPYRGCFGVGTNDSTAVFRSVRLKMLSGEARLLRPAGAGELATVPTGSTIRPGQWADLVPLIWLDRDRVRGEWEKTDSGLIKTTPEGHGRIMLPAAPDGSYELAFSFVREGGGGSVDAILPVGDHGVLYSLGGWKNTIHCLQQIDGRLGDSNPTCVRGMPLEQGRLYNALVRVERSGSQASVRGYLDGRVLTQWSGPATALSLRPEWSIPDRTRLGLMVNQLKATLPAIRLRMLSGEARVVAAAEAQRPGAADGPAATGPWVDLLPLVDPAKDTVHGKWEVQTGSLVGYPARLGRIAIPATTEGSYHLSVTFARTAGSGEVTFILPVGDSGVAFALGRRGGELLDAQTPPEGHALAELANGRFYELHATVLVQADQTEITFRLDGKHYLRWKGAPSALSVPRWCGLPHARGFGLGAWDSTVVFTSARLSMLSGKADRLR